MGQVIHEPQFNELNINYVLKEWNMSQFFIVINDFTHTHNKEKNKIFKISQCSPASQYLPQSLNSNAVNPVKSKALKTDKIIKLFIVSDV